MFTPCTAGKRQRNRQKSVCMQPTHLACDKTKPMVTRSLHSTQVNLIPASIIPTPSHAIPNLQSSPRLSQPHLRPSHPAQRACPAPGPPGWPPGRRRSPQTRGMKWWARPRWRGAGRTSWTGRLRWRLQAGGEDRGKVRGEAKREGVDSESVRSLAASTWGRQGEKSAQSKQGKGAQTRRAVLVCVGEADNV